MMRSVELPLLEDDLDSASMIEPAQVVASIDAARPMVLCFFREVMDALASRPDARKVQVLAWAHGEHPVYEFTHQGRSLAVMHPGVGAPLAGALLEEAIALGYRTFVAVGGAGALVPDLVMGHAVVVDSARCATREAPSTTCPPAAPSTPTLTASPLWRPHWVPRSCPS
jgi:uridine phosphorylase